MAKHDSHLDRLFSALGDPTRRAVLDRLARGPASVGELAAPHNMALPSFLAHLAKLESAGLITTAKRGRSRICALAQNGMVPAEQWLEIHRRDWESRLDRFDTYVTNLHKERSNDSGPQD